MHGDKMKYSCRPRLSQAVVEFELTDTGLTCAGLFGVTQIPFVDIDEIDVFKERRFGSSRSFWACTIFAKGQRMSLSAAHRVSFFRTEDRTSRYIPFIKEFESRSMAANSKLRFVVDEYREALGTKIYGKAAVWGIDLLGRLPRRVSSTIIAAIFRCIGTFLRGNRYARRQLAAALPTLGRRDTRRVLRGMWDNIGRTAAEYAFIPELIQFSPDAPQAGQVIMDQRTADLIHHIARDVRGALVFGAHLGNWEIPAMAARAGGREIAVLYKRQPSAALTSKILRERAKFSTRLIEGRPAALWEIVDALREGLLVGMLVDQYYAQGVEVAFFGKTCRVNPALALLARSGDWPIYGGRVIRLPDQRYQLEVVGPIQLAHNSQGEIDIRASMQVIIDIVEAWIRQYPEQWMWIHRLIR